MQAGAPSAKLEGEVNVSPRAGWLIVGVIVALAAVLRIIGAERQLWYDEILTLVDSIRQPLGVLVTHFPSNNDHVLYSVLAHISISLFGESPAIVRLPAIVFGVLSVGLIYTCGKTVTSRFEALSAALLAAVAYHHVWFSQNARGYTILLCVGLLSTQLLLTGLRDNKRWAFIVFGLVCALGAYTHLTMVIAVVGQALVVAAHILATKRRFVLADWISPAIAFGTAALATVVLYAPLLGDVQAFFADTSQGSKAASAGWALLETVRAMQVGPVMGVALFAIAIVFAAGCWSYLRRSPLVLGLFLVPPIFVWAVSAILERPTFPRFFFFVAGFLLLIVARGTMTITQGVLSRLGASGQNAMRPMLVLAALSMAAVAAVDLPRAYADKQDYAGALAYLKTARGAGDTVVTVGKGTTFPYGQYYGESWGEVRTKAELDEALRTYDSVYVVYTFKRYVERLPQDFQAALARCEAPRKFNGSLADGDIFVARCAGVKGAA